MSMDTLPQVRWDTVLFFQGLAAVLLAVVCTIPARRVGRQLPWHWLALFGLAQGIQIWLTMVEFEAGRSRVVEAASLALLTLSFAFLLEFGRAGLPRFGGVAVGRWIYPYLAGCALLAWQSGLPGLNVSVRYSFGLVGGLLAAAALFRTARVDTNVRLSSGMAAVLMATYALAAGVVVPKTGFLPASVVNQASFQAAFGISIHLACGGVALVLALLVAIHNGLRVPAWPFALQPEADGSSADNPASGHDLAVLTAVAETQNWSKTAPAGSLARVRVRE